MKTTRLSLVKPGHGTNVVEGNDPSGESNEAKNLDLIDAAIAAKYTKANYTTSTAIAEKEGVVTLSGGSAQAMTIADPTTGTDDGKTLTILATAARAHTVTFITALNGGANHKATFGGALGDQLNIEAVNGIWYFKPSVNQTLSAS